jgi:hypothetical protein
MFDISVEDPNQKGERLFAWQNSWGLSTRTIGVMVMVHGDNQGLVLPPRVANIQVVVVPCGVNEANQSSIYDACDKVAKDLKASGIRAKADLRENYLPGWKFNYWEQKVIRKSFSYRSPTLTVFRVFLFVWRLVPRILKRNRLYLPEETQVPRLHSPLPTYELVSQLFSRRFSLTCSTAPRKSLISG